MTCEQGLLRLLWGGPKLECNGTGVIIFHLPSNPWFPSNQDHIPSNPWSRSCCKSSILSAQYRTSYILLCNTLYKTSVYENNLEKTSRSQIVSNLFKNLKNPSDFINVSLSQQSKLSKMLSNNSFNCVLCLKSVLVIREVKFHLVGATDGFSWIWTVAVREHVLTIY